MNKTRYVVRLPHTVVIDTSIRAENFNLSLSDWVRLIRSGVSAPSMYRFNWHNGDDINVDCCELYGKFIYDDDLGRMSVNLYISCYPVFYCSMEAFMRLFRIGNKGWCISSVVNVL